MIETLTNQESYCEKLGMIEDLQELLAKMPIVFLRNWEGCLLIARVAQREMPLGV